MSVQISILLTTTPARCNAVPTTFVPWVFNQAFPLMCLWIQCMCWCKIVWKFRRDFEQWALAQSLCTMIFCIQLLKFRPSICSHQQASFVYCKYAWAVCSVQCASANLLRTCYLTRMPLAVRELESDVSYSEILKILN